MAQRNYSNNTSKATLSSPVAPTDLTLLTAGLTNPPTAPFTATIDRNTASEEVVLVTAVNGAALTVTRGYDSTAATTHFAGATVEHTAIARDFREANLHVNQTEGAHGTTGSLVGTEGAQSLLDKTLVSPLFESDTLMGDAAVAWSVDGVKNIFRGMNNNGDDVFIVEPDGQVVGAAATAPEHLTRKSQLDAEATARTNADTALSNRVTPLETANTAATAAATASTIMKRDASGNTAVNKITAAAAASAANELTRKDQVDSAIAADRAYNVTPVVPSSTAGDAGWTISGVGFYDLGSGFGQLTIVATRTGSVYNVSGTTGDVGNAAFLVITDTTWRPVVRSPLTNQNTGRTAIGSYNTDGTIAFVSTVGPDNIAIGESIQLTGIFRRNVA